MSMNMIHTFSFGVMQSFFVSTVFVSRFIVQDTIEGRIAEVLEKKRQLFNELIEQNGPPPSLGLSQEEVFGLFDLRVRLRRAA